MVSSIEIWCYADICTHSSEEINKLINLKDYKVINANNKKQIIKFY